MLCPVAASVTRTRSEQTEEASSNRLSREDRGSERTGTRFHSSGRFAIAGKRLQPICGQMTAARDQHASLIQSLREVSRGNREWNDEHSGALPPYGEQIAGGPRACAEQPSMAVEAEQQIG